MIPFAIAVAINILGFIVLSMSKTYPDYYLFWTIAAAVIFNQAGYTQARMDK